MAFSYLHSVKIFCGFLIYLFFSFILFIW